MAQKKKAKLRIDRIVICALILIALIVGIVFLIRFLAGKFGKTEPSSPTTPIGEEESEERPEQFLDIIQTDCSMVVGGSLQLTCDANPAELLDQITWTTTNDMVLSVSDTGRVKILGEGTAAIVAVAGTYSDSVIIVGIAEGSQQSTEYPIAASTDENASNENQTPENNTADSTNEPTGPSNSDSTKPSESVTTKPSEENPSTQGSSESAPTTSSPDSQEQPTTQPIVIDDYSAYLNEAANRLGLEAYYEGTYIYREDGNYLGEVIVGDNMTQLMVKMRTSSLDGTLKNFLASVLPTSYEAAYAKMIYASTTTTMRLDGLKVRVIVNNEDTESHKQLIIYY